MRTKPLLVAIWVFSFVFFFTSGCTGTLALASVPTQDAGPISTNNARPAMPPLPEPPAPILVDLVPHEDAGDTADVSVQLDASADNEDAPTVTADVTTDDAANTMVDDRPTAPAQSPAVAFLLAPITCHGRRLPSTTPGLDLAAQGMTLWHLCYKTPTRTTSTYPLPSQRAERVTLELATPTGEQLLLAVPAPASANPWTVSVLVALPAGVAPAFQGFTHYANHPSLAIVGSGDGESFPTIQGEMRSWRVLNDLSQDEYAPGRVCRRPTPLHPNGAFFLPLDMCPGRTCPLLQGLECQDLIF